MPNNASFYLDASPLRPQVCMVHTIWLHLDSILPQDPSTGTLGTSVTLAAVQGQWLLAAIPRAASKSSKKQSSERTPPAWMSEVFLERKVTTISAPMCWSQHCCWSIERASISSSLSPVCKVAHSASWGWLRALLICNSVWLSPLGKAKHFVATMLLYPREDPMGLWRTSETLFLTEFHSVINSMSNWIVGMASEVMNTYVHKGDENREALILF